MKITTKLTTLALGLTLPFTFTSCGDSDKKAVKDKVEETLKNKAESITDFKGLIELMSSAEDKAFAQLENITDMESAEAALKSITKMKEGLPDLEKTIEKLGGQEKLSEFMMSDKTLMMKAMASAGKQKSIIEKLTANNPEVGKFVTEKILPVLRSK